MSEVKPTILIVEDDDIDVRVFKRGLKKCDVENPVVVAYNGKEAFELLSQKSPSQVKKPYIVILDLNMPIMDGFDFLKSIRSHKELADTVVFVLTTSSAEADRKRAYENYVAGYMLKNEAGDSRLAHIKMIKRYLQSVKLPA